MPWSTDLAPTNEELTSCVQCGLCLPTCPTFRLTGQEAASPRGRLTAMAAVADGIATVDRTFADIMGFCLQCRACETACPSLVPFGRAMEGARAEVTAQQRKGFRKRVRHRWLGPKGLGSRRFMRTLSLTAGIGQKLGAQSWFPGKYGKGLRGLRRLRLRRHRPGGPRWEAYGPSHGTAAILLGCVMDSWFTATTGATIELLRRAGYDVIAPEGQTCCGALAAHDGAADQARSLAAGNNEAFRNVELIVANAAGCSAHLKEYENWLLPESDDEPQEAWSQRARDITEVIADAIDDGSLPQLPATGIKVAIQDPCHLRHAQKITSAPRTIVAAAGFEPVEIDPHGMCCGAAGIYSLLRPKASYELGRQKGAQVEQSGATVVASANPGCEMQLRTHLGRGYDIRHPVELYAERLVQ